MYADISYSNHGSLTGRLGLLLARLLHVPAAAPELPAELRRLPDHLLRDLGVERRDLSPSLEDIMTRADMLESRTAVSAWLASTIR